MLSEEAKALFCLVGEENDSLQGPFLASGVSLPYIYTLYTPIHLYIHTIHTWMKWFIENSKYSRRLLSRMSKALLKATTSDISEMKAISSMIICPHSSQLMSIAGEASLSATNLMASARATKSGCEAWNRSKFILVALSPNQYHFWYNLNCLICTAVPVLCPRSSVLCSQETGKLK